MVTLHRVQVVTAWTKAKQNGDAVRNVKVMREKTRSFNMRKRIETQTGSDGSRWSRLNCNARAEGNEVYTLKGLDVNHYKQLKRRKQD